MNVTDAQLRLRKDLDTELRDHILPYWMTQSVDHTYGGFYGRVNSLNQPVVNAPRSPILTTRILWTFSAAYRMFGDSDYLAMAKYAHSYLEDSFWDRKKGGVYWMIDYRGAPLDTKKHNYAQAFAMYGYSEYYRATGEHNALDRAIEIFKMTERFSLDETNRGYHEVFDRDWNPLSDARLSDEEIVVKRSMNTHLHLLEAFTNLYRVWPNERVRERIRMLIELFVRRIYDSRCHHFLSFFDEKWNVSDSTYSYGHDIEGSWLLSEAARVIDDPQMIALTDQLANEVASSVLAEGVDKVNGGLFYLGRDGVVIDSDKQWWAQAEAIIGFFDAYQKTMNEEFLQTSLAIWSFVKHSVIDHTYGEWFYRISHDGRPYLEDDKIGQWKCPYHTTRACMEVLQRTEKIVSIHQ